jgi:hypothetical protein
VLLKDLAGAFREFTAAIGTRADHTLTLIAERAKAEIDAAAAKWTAGVEQRRAVFLDDLGKTRLQRALDHVLAVSGNNSGIISTPIRTPVARPAPQVTANPRRIRQAAVAPDGSLTLRASTSASESGVGTVEQRILDALGWWRAAGIAQPSREQVAFVARYSVTGHFNNTLGALRSAGLVEYPAGGLVALTTEGLAHAVTPDAPPTRAELLARARAVLREEPLRRIYDAIVEAGAELSRDDLAQRTGYTVNGHFNNGLGRLRTLGFITYQRGGQVALSALFDAL